MPYVDGFLMPVPKKKIEAYRKIARKAAKLWKDHGAVEYVECVGDDLKGMWGVPFPTAVKAKPNETVIFSWVVYKSRAHRDQVNKKIMKDPRMESMMGESMKIFDGKRMSYGGFKTIVVA